MATILRSMNPNVFDVSDKDVESQARLLAAIHQRWPFEIEMPSVENFKTYADIADKLLDVFGPPGYSVSARGGDHMSWRRIELCSDGRWISLNGFNALVFHRNTRFLFREPKDAVEFKLRFF